MDVKCPGCYKITTVFSHAQTVVVCSGCSAVLCQPTGGKARLTEGTFWFLLSIRVFCLCLMFQNFYCILKGCQKTLNPGKTWNFCDLCTLIYFYLYNTNKIFFYCANNIFIINYIKVVNSIFTMLIYCLKQFHTISFSFILKKKLNFKNLEEIQKLMSTLSLAV